MILWRIRKLVILALAGTLTAGCAVVGAAGTVAGTAVKTTAKVGGAVIDGAVDAVDNDHKEKKDD